MTGPVIFTEADKTKGSDMGQILISAFKFVIAILLFPMVVASAISFSGHLSTYPATYEEFLMWGIGAFLLLYLFFHQFWGFYEFGQKIVANIFKFIAPLDRLVTNLLPFYLVLILLAFYVTKEFLKIKSCDPYFIFFAGFALAMHIILAAQDMQNQEKSPIKPTYLLEIAFVVVVAVSLSILLLDLIVGKWTFPDFLTSTMDLSLEYYQNIFLKIMSN